MANWKKIKKTIEIGIGVLGVLGVVGIVAGFILSIVRPGRPVPGLRPRPRPGPAAGGDVWFVGTGQTKKSGSWSSGRHR